MKRLSDLKGKLFCTSHLGKGESLEVSKTQKDIEKLWAWCKSFYSLL